MQQEGPLRAIRGCDVAATSQKILKQQIAGSWERISRGILSQCWPSSYILALDICSWPLPEAGHDGQMVTGLLSHSALSAATGPERPHCCFGSFGAKSLENTGTNTKIPPSVAYKYVFCKEILCQLPPLTEKQQGGKGALTSSASLPHSKDALLKSGKLALSPKKSLVNSSILTERALISMQRARPGSALWRRVPIPNFPGSHSS